MAGRALTIESIYLNNNLKMFGLTSRTGILTVGISAALYQLVIKDLLFVTLGLGRHIQNVEEFPYTCRRIVDPRLNSCEDMWLSESTRQLFLACSDADARSQWCPAMGRFNVSGISMTDAVVVMDIDSPKGDSFESRVLKLPDFGGTKGEGSIHLLGMTGLDSSETIQLLFVNNKPSIDVVTGHLLDQASVGSNSTVEHFVLSKVRSTLLKHVRTWSSPRIATPNNVAAIHEGAFYITNDHGQSKSGLAHQLSPFIATGDVTFCTSSGCTTVAAGLKFPNGLIAHPDGNIYVPSAAIGGITVYKPRTSPEGRPELEKIDHIYIPYAIDNLSVDANGIIFAAAFPKVTDMLSAFEKPMERSVRSTILKITKHEHNRYEWSKVIEDAESKVLPGSTVAVHDAKTGRLFLSGILSPYVTVCDPKRRTT